MALYTVLLFQAKFKNECKVQFARAKIVLFVLTLFLYVTTYQRIKLYVMRCITGPIFPIALFANSLIEDSLVLVTALTKKSFELDCKMWPLERIGLEQDMKSIMLNWI